MTRHRLLFLLVMFAVFLAPSFATDADASRTVGSTDVAASRYGARMDGVEPLESEDRLSVV
ncbi:MAG: hypothetical protein ACLFM6_10010, partial [Spirochaetaceae bacterium]